MLISQEKTHYSIPSLPWCQFHQSPVNPHKFKDVNQDSMETALARSTLKRVGFAKAVKRALRNQHDSHASCRNDSHASCRTHGIMRGNFGPCRGQKSGRGAIMPINSLNSRSSDRDGKPESLPSRSGHVTPREIDMWRRLRRGMSTAEVLTIFGAPTARTPSSDGETWRYDCGHSVMDLTLSFRGELLHRWTEPNPSLYMPNVRRPNLQPA